MNKISIGIKIGLGFIVVLIMFIVVSIVTIQNTKRMQKDADLMKHTYEVMQRLDQLSSDLKDAETGQRGYLLTGMEQYLEPYNVSIDSIEQVIEQLQSKTKSSFVLERIPKLKELVAKKLTELKQTIDLCRNEGFEAALIVVRSDTGKEIMDAIRVLYTELEYEEYRLLRERKALSQESSNRAVYTIIWLTSIACLIVIILIITYSRIVANPIKHLTTIAKDIAVGNLKGEIRATKSEDEIGVLSKSFTLMQQYLREKAEQADQIAKGNLTIDVTPRSMEDTMGMAFDTMANNLRTQFEEITEGVNVLSSSSSEIMATIAQMSSSSAETATSVSETTSTIEEVKQTADASSKKALQVSESSHQNIETSQQGTKSVQNTIDGMTRIKKQMESIASIVVRLSEQSNSIGEIVNSVNNFAEQSNLLAVNASIEAAKAGEQGKGFTVVAQEIKNLASRSKDSTSQIKNILSDIQKAISSAVMATEQGGKVVDEGLELSATSSTVISKLAESITQATEATSQIASVNQEQALAMDHITASMESIKEASIQAATSTKQSESSATELHKLGESLQEILKQYKLK